MSVLFYRLDRRPVLPDLANVSGELRIWRPAREGPPPRGSRTLANWLWWLFVRIGLFSRPDFVELSIWKDRRRVHRMIVTPRWYRFPFMAQDDLQIGDLWTDPAERGRGLARAALGEVLRRFGSEAERFWYVVEASNAPSVRLAQSSGMRLAGIGRRTCPFGLRALGRFEIQIPQS